MDVLYECCCGLDIQKKTVVACRAVPEPSGTQTKEARSFGAMTEDLLQLANWLLAALARGETDAALAQGRLRDKLPELERKLAGSISDHPSASCSLSGACCGSVICGFVCREWFTTLSIGRRPGPLLRQRSDACKIA
jgi:hypothetical protein